ncbi:hypothetical protein BaRGS_00038328, partial [Batillaria attramentaria]
MVLFSKQTGLDRACTRHHRRLYPGQPGIVHSRRTISLAVAELSPSLGEGFPPLSYTDSLPFSVVWSLE